MKIAIDVSPLSSGHNIRGVGFYLKNLLKALKKYHSEHEYLEFTDKIPKSVDVIHFSYFDPFSPNLPLLGDKKTVVTVHDLIPLVLPKLFPVGVRGKVHWLRQKFSLQRVGRIITNSNSSKHDIERLAHIPSLKITVTYLAAGEQFKQTSNLKRQTSNVKNKYNLPDIFALYVGDATANKNLPNLVKGILQTDIPLVIAGKTMTDETVDLSHSWTKDINQVRLLAKSNPKKIKLLGFVGDEDLVVLYNLAGVFIMPSLYEGFGLPILEAMACGCPVITTTRGAIKEVAGDAACFVNPEDIEGISKSTQKVIGDTKYANLLQKKGFEQAKKFSWEKTAEKTIEVYKKIHNE